MESILASYPSANQLYAPVPYKQLATLEDMRQFNKEVGIASQQTMTRRSGGSSASSASGLSQRMDAIRQGGLLRNDTSNGFGPPPIKKIFEPIPQPNLKDYLQWNYAGCDDVMNAGGATVDDVIKSSASHASEQTSVVSLRMRANSCSKPTPTVVMTAMAEEQRRPQNPSPNYSSSAGNIRRPFTAPNQFKCGSVEGGAAAWHSPPQLCVRAAPQTPNSTKTSLLRNSLARKDRSKSAKPHAAFSEELYQRQLEEFGWRMEVHGDPLLIKKPVMARRESYRVQLEIPEVLGPPPQLRKENMTTFFYNTIPNANRQNTFEISPDFQSERFNRAKNRLAELGKWNYSTKCAPCVY